jgi:hypothetical protein
LAITQNTPEYQIDIAVGSGSGYKSQLGREIAEKVKKLSIADSASQDNQANQEQEDHSKQ